MRPVRLTMSAFGSYAGVQEIDFTKIHSAARSMKTCPRTPCGCMTGRVADAEMEI